MVRRVPWLVVSAVSVLLWTAACASALTFTQPPGSPFSVGNNPIVLASTDFNGDGHADLAVANFLSNTVSVLLGDGAGGFSVASTPGTGAGPTSIVVGDLNRDGKPDLVVGNRNDASLSVLLGDGAGGFAPVAGSPIAVGAGPWSVKVADVNNDGKLDIVVVNRTPGTITVLLGDGAGGFVAAPGSPFAPGGTPLSIAVADFNGDGRLDLAVTDMIASKVYVMLGNGAGGFTIAVATRASFSSPSFLTAADFNSDGRPDVFVGGGGHVAQLLLGNGSGGLAPAGAAFLVGPSGAGINGAAVADFNADGKPDVAATFGGSASGVSVLLGDGSGAFVEARNSPVATGADPAGIAAVDLSADGRPDLAITNFDVASVTVQLNASLPQAAPNPTTLSFASQPQTTLSPARILTVANDTDNPLHVRRAQIIGANPLDFLIAADSCTGETVAGGESCSLAVYFAPSASGSRSATLQLLDDAASSPQQIAMSGIGAALPTGPVGPAGATGPVGPAGATGPAGPKGEPAYRLQLAVINQRITVTQGAKKITVSYLLTRDATITLEVMRGKKVLARASSQLAAHATAKVKAGRRTITWNGKIGKRAASPGTYKLVVRARSTDGQKANATATLTIRRRHH